MKHWIIVFTVILLMGCDFSSSVNEKQSSKDRTNKTPPSIVTDSTTAQKGKEMSQIPVSKPPLLTSRKFNNVRLEFKELSLIENDSLSERTISTSIPLEKTKDQLIRIDSCYHVHLLSGSKDTLCDFDDGEYYESFKFKGIWSSANQLLIQYNNWEEEHDFLYNMHDGTTYILGPAYSISPDESMILSYVDLNQYPIYSGEFVLSRFDKGGYSEIFNVDLGETSIKNVQWISNNQVLVTAQEVNYDYAKPTYTATYLMTLVFHGL